MPAGIWLAPKRCYKSVLNAALPCMACKPLHGDSHSTAPACPACSRLPPATLPSRSSLHVVASEKGVVVGRLTFREDGDHIDCGKMGVGGKAIPPNIDKVGAGGSSRASETCRPLAQHAMHIMAAPSARASTSVAVADEQCSVSHAELAT